MMTQTETIQTTTPISSRGLSLEDAKLEGDERISTPIGDIELIDNYFGDVYRWGSFGR